MDSGYRRQDGPALGIMRHSHPVVPRALRPGEGPLGSAAEWHRVGLDSGGASRRPNQLRRQNRQPGQVTIRIIHDTQDCSWYQKRLFGDVQDGQWTIRRLRDASGINVWRFERPYRRHHGSPSSQSLTRCVAIPPSRRVSLPPF